MCKDRLIVCANELYQEEVLAQLESLEHNDFDDTECASYTGILNTRASALKKLGIGKKLKWRCACTLFGTELVPMDVVDPRDAAHHALRTRLKTIAVSHGD